MSIDQDLQEPIVKRFHDELKLNGKSPRTQQAYCQALRQSMEFLGYSPETAWEDDVRKYLLFVAEQKKWSSSTVTVHEPDCKN